MGVIVNPFNEVHDLNSEEEGQADRCIKKVVVGEVCDVMLSQK